MSKFESMKNGEKIVWVKPELKRLEAGAAENLAGPTADGGGGAQGS